MSCYTRHHAPCKICYDAGRQEEAFLHSTRWNFNDGRGSIVTCPYLRCQTCANPNCVNHGLVRNPDHAHTMKYCEAPWPVEMQKGGCYEHLKYAQGAFTPEMYQMQMQMQMQAQMYAQSQVWYQQPEQKVFSVMKPAEPIMISHAEEKVADSLNTETVVVDIESRTVNAKIEEEEVVECIENKKKGRKRWADICDELSESEEESEGEDEEEGYSSEVQSLRTKSLWKRALLFAKIVARFNLRGKKRNECASDDDWEVNTNSKKLVVSMEKALNKIEEIKAHNCMVDSKYGFENNETDQEWLDRMACENNCFPSLCRHFEKKGCCNYGKNSGKSCNFLHIPKKKKLPVIRFKVTSDAHKEKKVRQRSVKSNNRFAFEDSDNE